MARSRMPEQANSVRFFIDSGAGQCMCSCADAFSSLKSCAIVVVGVAGNLPIRSFGTASFIAVDSSGNQRIIRIHNCLLCQNLGEDDNFNLISVSQVLKTTYSTVQFNLHHSSLSVKHGKHQQSIEFDLVPDDGLYAMEDFPVNASDPRHKRMVTVDLTVNEAMGLGRQPDGVGPNIVCVPTKPASKLGTWYTNVLWIGKIVALTGKKKGFDDGLKDFCNEYIAPLAIPPARRTYQTHDVDDLADLSIRFLGIGSERLKHTLERSIGLSPMVKENGKMRHQRPNPVPSHNFPQGRWKSGKTPKVDKGIIHNLHQASIGEVVYMDTFEVEDSAYRYAQAFVDYRSNYGDIIPLRSRTQVGKSFAEFCARNFTPLILIRDNIGEHIGGDLMKECLRRSVKSAFICPYRKQQNYAEGYLGRVTALASYGMVYAGAPMFMWIWCIECAVFINNITAAFYSAENIWATPYEVVHNEPFMDASIVVPFGCGVLVLLTEEERGKFQDRCALMIFAHYANQHPLYTYAVYSPRTKRILFRQDCIFLTNLFTMRSVRSREGLHVDGDQIIPYRSPLSVRDGGDERLSFQDWDDHQPLPHYQDHITGFNLSQPCVQKERDVPNLEDTLYVYPNNPNFGPPSVVKVPYHQPRRVSSSDIVDGGNILESKDCDAGNEPGQKRRSRRSKKITDAVIPTENSKQRKPVGQRWYYEPVENPTLPDCEATIQKKADVDKVIHQPGECRVIRWEDYNGCCKPGEYDPELDAFVEIFHAHAIGAEDAAIPTPILVDESEGLPLQIGPVVSVSLQDIQNAGSDEWAAWYLQGIIFYDEELGWCRIIGWGVECGVIILHYTSVTDFSHEEHHSSLAEMLAMMTQSPKQLVIPDYQPSRVLCRSEMLQKALFYRSSGCTVLQRGDQSFGSSSIRRLGSKVGSYNGHRIPNSTIKRILRAQETIFKYGTMIPRNDTEADRSPEAARWISGRSLEWIRLNNVAIFDGRWSWKKVQQMYPNYLKSDIGHMFFIYDYKFSGEHRVRLVFDGSKQSAATYSVTYAPTVRAESVRLFHIYAIEYSWEIQQYDVPQAFLRSDADCDIFAYPPKGFAEFPGQLLKLSKMLYGSKQAAALWYNLLNTFLL
jgi:hypothetical protein